MSSQSPPNDRWRLYRDLSWVWPIISPPKDYIKESELFSKIVREHSRIQAETLLDLGCGGGHNDHTLKKHFEVTGVEEPFPCSSVSNRPGKTNS